MANVNLLRGEKLYLCEKLEQEYRVKTNQDAQITTARDSHKALALSISDYFEQENKKQLFGIAGLPKGFEVSDGQLEGLFKNGTHRAAFIDACYVYLHGKTRADFLKDNLHLGNPFLIKNITPQYNAQNEATTSEKETELKEEIEALLKKVDALEVEKNNELVRIETEKKEAIIRIEGEKMILDNQLKDSTLKAKNGNRLKWVVPILLGLIGFLSFKWYEWHTIKKDMHILQYQPNQAEIDKLVGIWTSDIGSALTRPLSDKVKDLYAHNVMEITYVDAGYFKIHRWGVRFSYVGYAQYESDSLISIMTKQENDRDYEVMPKIRHSLMRLDRGNDSFRLIVSVSWEHSKARDGIDIDDIIGIREVYKKVYPNTDCHVVGKPIPGYNGAGYAIINTSRGILNVIEDSLKNYQDSSLVGYQSFIKRDPRKK
jgi:hypothetical protein